MNPHELILLSPYRFPGQNSLMVGNEDIGAFLNGYLTLWHPAVALGAAGPPRVASPYDHEQPVADEKRREGERVFAWLQARPRVG